MHVPYRKPTKFSHIPMDPVMTQEKFADLKRQLTSLKMRQPEAAREVARLAELGDFSENVEYQMAKGKLRGINNAILRLEAHMNQAEIIKPSTSGRVEIGNTVTVEVEGKQRVYQILGSSEVNPEKGIISYSSPIGAALLGKKEGERVQILLAKKEVNYTIIAIQ